MSGVDCGNTQSPSPPMLSVIVPVYNAREELTQCLASLAESHYDDFEVIVVDDGSEIPIEPLVTDKRFRYMRIDGPGGPARARNRGAESARGRYVVFIDADVSVHSDTLALMARIFREDLTIDAVIGSYDEEPAHPSFISQYKNLFHHYIHQQSAGDIKTFWSGCGAMRRSLFLDSGGFDEKRYRRPAIEDIELGTWLSAAGHRIVLDGRIKAKHLKRWTLVTLLKTDIFDRGIPWTRLMFRAGDIVSTLNVTPVQRLSVVLTYLTLFASLAAFYYPLASIGAALLVLTVTGLNLDFYRFINRRQGFWFVLRVIPMHWLYFSYCGFSVAIAALLHYLERERSKKKKILPRSHTKMHKEETRSSLPFLVPLRVTSWKGLFPKAQVWPFLIIIAVGVFYLSTIRQGHPWGDDFGMYISHARNIVEGKPYRDTGIIYNPKQMLGPKSYPPIYPLMLAPIYKLWGLNLTAMKVEIILVFLLALLVIYLAFKAELDWPYLPAFVALIGFNPRIWHYKENIISDLPFLLFSYLSLWLVHQAYRAGRTVRSQIFYALLITASTFLAYGTRTIGLVLVPCFFVYCIVRGKKAGLFGLSIILLTAAVVYLQTKSSSTISNYAGHFGFNEMNASLAHLRKLIECLSEYWTNGSNKILRVSLFAVLLGLSLVGYVTRVIKKRITCFELFAPFYLLPLVLLPIELEARYMIPIIPLYLFYSFLGMQAISRRWTPSHQVAEKVIFAGLMLALLISYVGQYAISDYGMIKEGTAKAETQQLFEYVKKETSAKDVIVFRKPRALSLFTRRTAVVWHYSPRDEELLNFFQEVNASRLIVGPPNIEPYDQTYIREFVERNRGRFQEIFANADFRVYRIVRDGP